jgi:hypothetical protein
MKDKCPICWGNIRKRHCHKTKCGHKTCINRWFQIKKSCPYCTKNLGLEKEVEEKEEEEANVGRQILFILLSVFFYYGIMLEYYPEIHLPSLTINLMLFFCMLSTI